VISPGFGFNIPLWAYHVEKARQRAGSQGLEPVRPGLPSRSKAGVLSRLGHSLLARGRRQKRQSPSPPSLVL